METKWFAYLLLSFTALSCTTDEPRSDENENAENNSSTEVSAEAWNAFESNNTENILIDFSYAGYMRGEESIPVVSTLGYPTFDITDYGAVANDDISDRAAFIAAADAVKANGCGILYIPEGVFDIHTAEDQADPSESIIITTGNLILKGAGRGVSVLRMSAEMLPTDPDVLYSSAVAINIKHNSTISHITDVISNSTKGNFSLWVDSSASLAVNDWICLYLQDNSQELVEERLGDNYDNISSAADIKTNGIQVWEYHQIKSITGNRVEFYEPLMHDVECKWSWGIYKYPHYEGVGVEDLTFEGFAKDDFVHHGSWQDDGAYKPINLMRLTNSWMRRVGFVNVSEASSIVNCANVSVYDITIEGNVGHSAIRSQCSSRTFLGKITDLTGGGQGQYHSVGASKQSIGAVLWRNEWGSNSCFESHATQPRATLIDACKGAFIEMHQGGDSDQLPNHMEDLTLWNLNATSASTTSPFAWWSDSSSWKFLPPIIVGLHGSSVTFDSSQTTYEESIGEAVYPESLYEAQLKLRLGSLPSWLVELKTVTH